MGKVSESAVVLNTICPALREGWEARRIGVGELAVRMRAEGRYVILPVLASSILPHLDGRTSLSTLADRLFREKGTLRHASILDCVARLYEAGFLAPLDAEATILLEGQVARKPAEHPLLRVIGKARLLIPFRLGGRGTREAGAVPIGIWVWSLVGVTLLLLSLTAFSVTQQSGAPIVPLGVDPVRALLLIFFGVIAAASIRGLAQAVLLLIFGRTVQGFGLTFTLAIPHLDTDDRDGVMLARSERMAYRAACFAAMALLSGFLALIGIFTEDLYFIFIALGGWLALLANSSPIWPSDASEFLAEALRFRRYRSKSIRYVLRRVWLNTIRRGGQDREEWVLPLVAGLGFVYLFILVAVLSRLLPVTLDVGLGIMLETDRVLWTDILAAVLSIYVWVAFAMSVLAVIGTALSVVVQWLLPKRTKAAPYRVVSGESLSLSDLADEVAAVPPFTGLPQDLIVEILKEGRVEFFHAGDAIIRQWDTGDTCYVLRSGTCEVQIDDYAGASETVAHLEPGALFGETALLEPVPRTASVVANGEAEVIAIDRETFLSLVEEGAWDASVILDRVRIHTFMKRHPVFCSLPPGPMSHMMAGTNVRRIETGTEVIREGDHAGHMYVIFRGACEVTKAGSRDPLAQLGPGEYFGEIATLVGTRRTATVRCTEPTILVELPPEIVEGVLVGEFATGLMLHREIEARMERLALL